MPGDFALKTVEDPFGIQCVKRKIKLKGKVSKGD